MSSLLHELLSASASRSPGREAVIDGDRVLTYRQLEEASKRVADALAGLGVARGDRVGLHLPKSLEAVVAIFGTLKAGAAYVPLDPSAPPRRTAWVIGDCGLKALVTTPRKAAALRPLWPDPPTLRCVVLVGDPEPGAGPPAGAAALSWQEVMGRRVGPSRLAALTGSDLAYLLYTSGSTGQPKGVMISHRAALAFVDWAGDTFHVQGSDRLSSHAPFHFDLSVFDLFATVRAGAAVALVPEALSVFPVELADWVEAQRISIWYSVPSVLTRLVLHGSLQRHRFTHLRQVLFAGEVFPPKYLAQLQTSIPHARYYNLYGPTETNVCTYYPVPAGGLEAHDPIPLGKACSGDEVFAVTDRQTAAAPGEVGELYVRGPSLMSGYWGLAEATRKALVPDPLRTGREPVYRTGDLVRQDAGGNYHFLGRRDHQIKSRGYRIELGEIESVLSRHPQVEEAAVIALPDEEIGHTLKAVVACRAGQPPAANDLVRFCAESLPRYMVPGRVEVRAALPRTSTGKIDRARLLEEELKGQRGPVKGGQT